MFQVLLADDEPSVIQSLKESIDWAALDMELAACVADGKEVLSVVEHQQIDIAILDIRMPGLSGLELCEYLRRKQENIQLIIISGYAEFSYAERAIRYGVLGYCLKPLEYEKVTKLLLKASKNLQKEAFSVPGSDFLDAIDSGNEKEVTRILNRMGLLQNRYYVTVSVGEDKLMLPNGSAMTVEFGRGQCGYISEQPFEESVFVEYLAGAAHQGIGYLEKPVNAAELSAAIHTCTVQAYQFFVNPSERICRQLEEEKANEFLNVISQNVEKNRWDLVCEQLQIIEEKYRNCFSVRTSLKLCNIIYNGNLFREEKTDYYIYSLKQLVSGYGSLSNMIQVLKNAILEARAAAGTEENFSNTAFMKLMEYIGENYKGEISLTSTGAALHMSPNYVSQLFKKEAGITFIHYITQLRMEDAIRLLTTTKMPVVDIAMEVGFNDYFYFLKTFKKFTQKTPSQYREEA